MPKKEKEEKEEQRDNPGPEQEQTWWDQAVEAAIDFFNEITDRVTDFVLQDGEASNDFRNDYDDGDEIFHEMVVDKEYDLLEAAQILDELTDYEETDSGLWEGQEPREAIATQAAFTFGNAVESIFRDLIEKINQAIKQTELSEDDAEAKKQLEHIYGQAIESL